MTHQLVNAEAFSVVASDRYCNTDITRNLCLFKKTEREKLTFHLSFVENYNCESFA